jgi:hypothetical protein
MVLVMVGLVAGSSGAQTMRRLSFRQLRAQLEQKAAARDDVTISRRWIHYQHGKYPFYRIASKEIRPEDRVLLIQAGLHGDEVAGPMTLAHRLDEIIDLAHKSGLKVIIYPLANPSGYSKRTRYNADNDRGSVGNADFLRYELADGSFVDDIGRGKPHKGWRWSSQVPQVALPKETQLIHALLQKEPLSQVVALLDLHQDYLTPGAPPAAYHYSFGRREVYRPIVRAISKLVPVWRRRAIGAGFGVSIDDHGRIREGAPAEQAQRSDAQGFIVRHDGSLPDLFYRMGVPLAVTAETTGATPLKVAEEVNMAWIRGLVDLASRRGGPRLGRR